MTTRVMGLQAMYATALQSEDLDKAHSLVRVFAELGESYLDIMLDSPDGYVAWFGLCVCVCLDPFVCLCKGLGGVIDFVRGWLLYLRLACARTRTRGATQSNTYELS